MTELCKKRNQAFRHFTKQHESPCKKGILWHNIYDIIPLEQTLEKTKSFQDYFKGVIFMPRKVHKATISFEKWLTDVTEFKYYACPEVKKLYLSAILDLYDRCIIAYKVVDSNNNELVFTTFDEATSLSPNAKPIFHSDRGSQYTNKVFHQKLVDAGMIQSMSRVGRCLDNAPMEGWWGILKSEMYYLKKFTSREELASAIENYIHFYNTRRYQKRLNCMTPCEYYFATAA